MERVKVMPRVAPTSKYHSGTKSSNDVSKVTMMGIKQMLMNITAIILKNFWIEESPVILSPSIELMAYETTITTTFRTAMVLPEAITMIDLKLNFQ